MSIDPFQNTGGLEIPAARRTTDRGTPDYHVDLPKESDLAPDGLDVLNDSHFTHFSPSRKFGRTDDPMQGSAFYVFVTAPSLFLDVGNRTSSPYLNQMFVDRPDIIEPLTFGVPKIGSSQIFINLLTNTCEGFTPSDTTMQTQSVYETWNKIKHAYPGEDNDSRSGGSFQVEYEELAGAPATHTHKVWYEYIQGMRRGELRPNSTFRDTRVIEYMSSMYFFLLGPDGMTIEYWAKYTGVMPTAIPYSAFSGKKVGGEPLKISIPYSYVWKEDMEPEVLVDFNMVSQVIRLNDTNLKDFASITVGEEKASVDTRYDVLEKRAQRKTMLQQAGAAIDWLNPFDDAATDPNTVPNYLDSLPRSDVSARGELLNRGTGIPTARYEDDYPPDHAKHAMIVRRRFLGSSTKDHFCLLFVDDAEAEILKSQVDTALSTRLQRWSNRIFAAFS